MIMTLSISSTTIIAYLIQEINDYFPELFPGARRANAWAVDKSVDNVDNWEFGEFGSLTRGLTDMTTMPLYWVGYH